MLYSKNVIRTPHSPEYVTLLYTGVCDFFLFLLPKLPFYVYIVSDLRVCGTIVVSEFPNTSTLVTLGL